MGKNLEFHLANTHIRPPQWRKGGREEPVSGANRAEYIFALQAKIKNDSEEGFGAP